MHIQTVLLRTFNALKRAHQRRVARRQLMKMDYYSLKDIGMTHFDVIREANKPFWKR